MAKQRQVSGKLSLQEVLDDPSTAAELERFASSCEETAWDTRIAWGSDPPPLERWEEFAVADAARWTGAAPLLRRLIYDRLASPRICAMSDLEQALGTYMATYFKPNARGLEYFGFRTTLNAATAGYQQSGPFPVFTGVVPSGCRLGSDDLWRGPYGLRVSLLGTLMPNNDDPDQPDDDPGPPSMDWRGVPEASVWASIDGQCSPAAMAEIVSEVRPLLSSLFATVWCLLGDVRREALWYYGYRSHKIDEDDRPHNFWLIPACLEAYFAEPTTKDSIDRRIRNAVALLSEADRQASHAVGLALAVAAMEALVGRKGEGIVSSIADNVAALLEPDLDRRADAVEFSKRIYDLRSRVMHGEAIESERAVLGQARLLASGLLKAMLERRATMRRLGEEPETPEDLLREMKRGRFAAGLPGGVTESIARTLWGAPTDNAP